MHEDPAIIQILKTEDQLNKLSVKTTDVKKETDNIQKTLESLYQTVFENSAVAITLTDEHERIISWNKYAEQLLEMNKEDLLNRPVKSLYPEDEWQKIRQQNVRQKGMQHHLETKIIRKNDRLLDVDISLSIVKNYGGKIIGSIGIIKDISEQKKIKLELEESEKRFKQLYERAPIPYHTLSPDGILTDVNEKWCEVFGCLKQEVIGKSIFDFITEDEREFARRSFKNKQQSRQAYIGGHERRYSLKNGEQRVFVTHDFFSFNSEGKIISVQTTMEDMTDRKKAEEDLNTAHKLLSSINQELEQKVEERTVEVHKLLKQKDDFINQLGHDLKSPLTPILNLLPSVVNNPDDPKNKERLDIISRNATYIKNLVTDTLKLARLNSSSVQLDIKSLSLSSMVTNILKDSQTLFEEKKITIRQIFDGNLVVLADEVQLKEVFNNLCSNSLKFMNQGGILTIQAHKNQNDGYITVSVTDTGVGLTDEQKSHIFNEFFKADASRHELGSSGLGLTICKRIIERHGGRIWVESPGLGKGATFFFTIPAQDTKRKQ
jgi:PAS domain S-box-containing protein